MEMSIVERVLIAWFKYPEKRMLWKAIFSKIAVARMFNGKRELQIFAYMYDHRHVFRPLHSLQIFPIVV